jgi:hypothetical protein
MPLTISDVEYQQFRADGMGYDEVAQRKNVSAACVRKYCSRKGWSLSKRLSNDEVVELVVQHNRQMGYRSTANDIRNRENISVGDERIRKSLKRLDPKGTDRLLNASAGSFACLSDLLLSPRPLHYLKINVHRIVSGVEERTKKIKSRGRYMVGCPNAVWHADGNEKQLYPFSIYFHVCVDGDSRKLMWLFPSCNKKSNVVKVCS